MPPRTLLRAFLALWLTTGIVLLIGSIDTARAALAASSHTNPHLIILGGVEAVAAVLFLVPRTLQVGAVGLVATIAVAFVFHAAIGQFRGDLLLYAAVVTFIAIHRPLTGEQLRVALSNAAG